jgi:hypothetical protein
MNLISRYFDGIEWITNGMFVEFISMFGDSKWLASSCGLTFGIMLCHLSFYHVKDIFNYVVDSLNPAHRFIGFLVDYV